MPENIGLADAIAGQNNSSGNFGNEFLQGFNHGQANAFKHEQARALAEAKQRKEEADFKKMITNKAKYKNLEVAAEYDPIINQGITDSFMAFKRGEDTTPYLNDTHMKSTEGSIMDATASNIKINPQLSVIYNGTQGGIHDKVAALENYQSKYLMPQRFVQDENTGIGNVVPIPNIPSRIIDQDIDKGVTAISKAHEKLIGTTGSRKEYQLDVNDPNFQKSKQNLISELSSNKDVVNSIKENDFATYSKLLDKKREEVAQKEGRDIDEYDAKEVVDKMIADKVDRAIVPVVKSYVIPQGKSSNYNSNWFIGGSNKAKWEFDIDPNTDETIVNVGGKPAADTKFKGEILKSDGSVGKEVVAKQIDNFRAKFDPTTRTFTITGGDHDNEGRPITLKATEATIRNIFHDLNDKGMAANFKGWTPLKAGQKAAPVKQKTWAERQAEKGK